MLLAQRVKGRRIAAGLTMGQLATYSQVSKAWISQIEHGLIEEPGAQRLERVAAQLGCSVSDLVGGAVADVNLDDPEIELLLRQYRSAGPSERDIAELKSFVQWNIERLRRRGADGTGGGSSEP